jgi:hypothetical protein
MFHVGVCADVDGSSMTEANIDIIKKITIALMIFLFFNTFFSPI